MHYDLLMYKILDLILYLRYCRQILVLEMHSWSHEPSFLSQFSPSFPRNAPIDDPYMCLLISREPLADQTT